MKNQKNKDTKPNKIKIEMALDHCKESVQDLLEQYQTTIDGYLAKLVSLKREKRMTEAERYKQKLKLVLSRQAKMQDLLDRVEQFSYMIDEAFAKSAVYSAMESVLTETNKINMSLEIKKMLKEINAFDDIFTKGLGKMDAVFGQVSKKISDIDQSTASTQDKEIDDIVASRLEQYDRKTTEEAESDAALFRLDE